MPGTGVIRIATPDGQVKEYSVDFDSAIVGRADGNRIVIPHVSVSRRHAHLTFADGQLMVEDFASATGTFVDGHQLLAGERLPIRPGADVRFGEARAIWVVPDVAPPPPPPLASELSQPAVVQPPVVSGPIVSNPDFVVSTPPPVYVPLAVNAHAGTISFSSGTGPVSGTSRRVCVGSDGRPDRGRATSVHWRHALLAPDCRCARDGDGRHRDRPEPWLRRR